MTHSGSLNSNNIVYLSSDPFSGFLNNILFVWPLFGLFSESILPETPYPEQSTEVYGLWGSRLYWLTISDQEFETFWPLAKFYHNRYTLDLQNLYSCQYKSHEHEYIFYFFIVQLWKLTEASRSSKACVSGDWNGCHIKVTVNCQGFDTITDPVLQIFRSILHRALRSDLFFSVLLPMERPGL